jgi:predicted dienelactone hydrolase
MHQRLLILAAALGAAACGEDDDPLPPTDGPAVFDARIPDAPPPDAAGLAAPADRAALFAPGPYTVGYRTATVTYRPAGRDTDRTLAVDLWYPATPGTGEDTVYRVAGVIEVEREGPRTGAEPLAGPPFPVIVYSHGSGGVGLAGFSYGEHFASWGFVVAAPDHTGNTVLDRTNPGALNLLVRPQDLSATLDWVTADAASPVAGLTSEVIAAIGHSFGGYGALSLLGPIGDWTAIAEGCDPESCAIFEDPAARAALDAGFLDERVDAIVAQTPVVMTFPEAELAALERPVMYATARRDQTLPWDEEGRPGWERLDGPDDVWIDLLNGGHYSVVAVCDAVAPEILMAAGLDVVSDGCGPDFTPIAEIVPVVTAYAHAFVRQHALGEARWGAVIRGEPFHATVEVTVGAD